MMVSQPYSLPAIAAQVPSPSPSAQALPSTPAGATPVPAPSGVTSTPSVATPGLNGTIAPVTTPSPAASPIAPPELPHWVTLGHVEKGLAESLTRLLNEADQHLAVLQDLKAHRYLLQARKLCLEAERNHLVLGLHPEWLLLKTRLAALDERVSMKLENGVDTESNRRLKTLAQQLESLVGEAEKCLPTETLDRQVERLNALRVRWDTLINQPELAELAGWQRMVSAYVSRMERLEQQHELAIVKGQLLETMARIALLVNDGQRVFETQAFEQSRSQYVALEDACQDFLREASFWSARGLNLDDLTYENSDGKLTGRVYLNQVRAWLKLARDRQKPALQQPRPTPDTAPPDWPRVPHPPVLPDA